MKKLFVLLFVSVLAVPLCGLSPAFTADLNYNKVAGVWYTPADDAWTNCIHRAIIKSSKKFGLKYEFTESVAAPDFERVLRDSAGRGFGIIIGDGLASEEACRRVAKNFPDTAFLMASGLGAVKPNYSISDNTDSINTGCEEKLSILQPFCNLINAKNKV